MKRTPHNPALLDPHFCKLLFRKRILFTFFAAGLFVFIFLWLPVTALQEQGIYIGATVVVKTEGARLNLRERPTTSANIVTPLENGSILEVIAGPEYADNIEWWQVQGETGKGWAAGQFLQLVTSGDGQIELPTGNTSENTEGENGSESEVNTTIIDQAPDQRVSSVYGFSGICFLGWRKPTWDDPLPFSLDTGTTYKSVAEANDLLSQIGFSGDIYENAPANVAVDNLENDSVFFFFGHGGNIGLAFHDDDCNYTYLRQSELQDKPIRNENLDLAVLLGCETGKAINSPDNILVAFRNVGATKAIGFNQKIWEIGAERWSALFWQYAIEDGLEVSDAAQKAINDNIHGIYWVVPSTLVILGEEDVYLQEQKTVFPTDNPPELPDLSEIIVDWGDALREWWQNLLSSFEGIINNFFQQILEDVITGLEDLLAKLINQLCSAPSSLLTIIVIQRVWQRIKKKRNE